MPNGGYWAGRRIDHAARLSDYLDLEISQCQQEIKRLRLQLSIDRDYVESPEAEPGEIDYFRLQVQLEQLELEFLGRRLGVLTKWAR